MVSFRMTKCSGCGLPLEVQILGLSSGLGPARVACRRCQAPIATERRPWPPRGAAWLRFLAVSAFYLGVGGLIGGNLLYAAWAYWGGNPAPPSLPFEDLMFRRLVAVSAGFMALVLAWKVVWASRPVARDELATDHLLSWNLVFGAHLKVLFFLLACTGLGWLKLKAG